MDEPPAGRRRLGLTTSRSRTSCFTRWSAFSSADARSSSSRHHQQARRIRFIFSSRSISSPSGTAEWRFTAAWSAHRRDVVFVRKHPGLSSACWATRSSSSCRSASPHAHRELHQRRALGRRLLADHPWCLIRQRRDVGLVVRHPAQLYEAALDLLTLPVLLWLYGRKPKDGVVAWTWFTIYGITRSVAEHWRQADFTGTGSPASALRAPMIAIGIR